MVFPKIILRTLLSFCFAFFALFNEISFAQSELIRYTIQKFPTNNRPCNEIASQIADRFANITGKAVETWTCTPSGSAKIDLTLFYLSDERIRLESTWGAKLMPEGTYKSEIDCWQDVESKVNQFRHATGLEPVVAYCFRETYADSSDHPYVLRIDAFGSGKKRFYSENIPIGLSPQTLPSDFIGGIRSGLNAVGADIFAVFMRVDPFGMTKLSLSYYDDLPVNLRFSGSGFFDNEAVCESQRHDALESSTAVGQDVLASSCIKKEYGTWLMTLVHFYNPDVQSQEFPTIYPELAACRQDLDRVLQVARNRYGWNVRSGYCAGMDREWRVYAYRNIEIVNP